MHYLGQAGISNYDCVYPIPLVVGAVIIAVAASVIAVCIFFLFRLSWDTTWCRRPVCAIVFASAVSGMHWLASVGTQYRLKRSDPSLVNSVSETSTVIVVIVLVSQTHRVPMDRLTLLVCRWLYDTFGFDGACAAAFGKIREEISTGRARCRNI
jgi:NO-binding membrane sensor protein with MHYT domain